MEQTTITPKPDMTATLWNTPESLERITNLLISEIQKPDFIPAGSEDAPFVYPGFEYFTLTFAPLDTSTLLLYHHEDSSTLLRDDALKTTELLPYLQTILYDQQDEVEVDLQFGTIDGEGFLDEGRYLHIDFSKKYIDMKFNDIYLQGKLLQRMDFIKRMEGNEVSISYGLPEMVCSAFGKAVDAALYVPRKLGLLETQNKQ